MHKVMLVDDEGYARQGLRSMIDWESCGYEVCAEAEDGEEALRLMREHTPDLVITDIRMPVLSGLELISSVRAAGNEDVKFIIVSGYGDFTYAKQAIKFGVRDFILKPVDDAEMTDALQGLAQQIERQSLQGSEASYSRQALEGLLRSAAAGGDGIGQAKQAGLDPSSWYGYMLLEANGIRPQLLQDHSEERLLELRSCITASAEELGLDVQPWSLTQHKPGVYGLPVRMPSGLWASLETLGERMVERLRRKTGLRFMAYVGEPAASPMELSRSYRNALEAMPYKFAYAEQRAISLRQLQGVELRRLEFESGEHARLMEMMEDSDSAVRHEGIQRIFDQFHGKRYAPDAVHNAIGRFAFGMISSIRSLQGDEKELLTMEPILSSRDYPLALQELKDLFQAFIDESSEMAGRLRKNNAKGDILKIKQYIDNRYNEDISLKNIAAKFYMNPVYLGQLFKKSYGVYFNDYLLQLRIHHAKKLLRQTEMRVYEIARCVGFDSPDYFICKFEKVEGKSPTSYRNELLS